MHTKYLHCLGLEKMPVMALEVGKSPARLGSRKMYQTLLCWEVGVESRYRHGFPGNLALMFDTGWQRGWGWSMCLQRLIQLTHFCFTQGCGSWLQHT